MWVPQNLQGSSYPTGWIRRSSIKQYWSGGCTREYLEILVHWVGYSTANASWEKKADFISRFSKFVLEDKDVCMGGGMLQSLVS
jgi:hypothetical protein